MILQYVKMFENMCHHLYENKTRLVIALEIKFFL